MRLFCQLGWSGPLALVIAATGAFEAAKAGTQLDELVRATNACIAVGKAQACPAGVAALQQLRQAKAYGPADRDCKEQVSQFDRVLALLPIQDVTDQTVQASLDGVVQACASSGL